jgi:hypothetical protein
MGKSGDVLRITPAAISAAVSGNLENFIAAATPGGIERQEAAGQVELCSSSTRLPKNVIYPTLTPEVLAEKLGIKVNGDYDDIFWNVELPAGWKIVPTDHAMHNDLVDNKGRRRAGIFYKAAFYDRNAHISFTRRFSVESEYQDVHDCNNHNRRVVVKDINDVIFDTPWSAVYAEGEAARERCQKWLDEQFPENKDVFAYWD